MSVVTSTDPPKSTHNCCVIEVFLVAFWCCRFCIFCLDLVRFLFFLLRRSLTSLYDNTLQRRVGFQVHLQNEMHCFINEIQLLQITQEELASPACVHHPPVLQ